MTAPPIPTHDSACDLTGPNVREVSLRGRLKQIDNFIG